jgi:PIN domain nuclease of toxin-antitoxin system
MPEIRLQSILNTVLNIPSYTVTPFDLQVFLLARSLPQHLQIHDRVIGATGRLYGVPVITRDGRLRDQVETFW